MKRTLKSRDDDTWKNLFTSYKRPHLEFKVPVFNTYAKDDMINTQNNPATTVLVSFKYCTYSTILDCT